MRSHRSWSNYKNLLRLALTHQRLTIAASEFLDAAGGIDEFLLTSKIGMTGSTNANLNIAASRPSAIDSSARAGNRGLRIVRMDISLHDLKKIPKLTQS